MGSLLWLWCRVNYQKSARPCWSRILLVRAVGSMGQGDRGHSCHRSTEEAPPLAMSLEWLPTGCCASYPSWHRCGQAEMSKIGASDGCRESGVISSGDGGAKIQLRGLDTQQLKGSLVVLYAPAGNSCLLRLVGHAWMDGWMDGWIVESCLCWCGVLHGCLLLYLL